MIYIQFYDLFKNKKKYLYIYYDKITNNIYNLLGKAYQYMIHLYNISF